MAPTRPRRAKAFSLVPAKDVRARAARGRPAAAGGQPSPGEPGCLREAAEAGLVLAEYVMRKKVNEAELKRKQMQSMHWVTARRLTTLETHHKNHVLRLNNELDAQKAKVYREQTEKLMYREEVEHKETVVSALEEDLSELRSIHNEAQAEAEARDRRRDLPPAYGSLPEDGRLPPYEVHCNDSGALDVATFKRTLRDRFMRQTLLAQKRLHDQRIEVATNRREILDGADIPLVDMSEADVESAFLLSVSAALADAARTAEDVLQRSNDIATTHIQTWIDQNVASVHTESHLQRIISKQKAQTSQRQGDPARDGAMQDKTNRKSQLRFLYPQVNGRGLFDPVSLREHPELLSDELESSRLCRVIERQASRHSYVADRFAKLILDLLLRTLAVLEVRPLTLLHRLSPQNKAMAALSWSQVDASLSEALRVAFGSETNATAAERLLQLQSYLTQIQMLQHRLDIQVVKLPITQWLDQTWLWLSDQVESQRQEASREYDEAQRTGHQDTTDGSSSATTSEDDEDMISRRVREGSELSSEPERDDLEERDVLYAHNTHNSEGRSYRQRLLNRNVPGNQPPGHSAAISAADRRSVADAFARSRDARLERANANQRRRVDPQARSASLDSRWPALHADGSQTTRTSPTSRRSAWGNTSRSSPVAALPPPPFPPPPPAPTVEDAELDEREVVDNVVRT
ncbi:hypothetical protein Tdes44962_MAKER10440 [Teratosphaeria destructans]|uniref:Uncharacterized protein n=1 Tax=Teratosphaeria destructans TaxID=418781 RepID=A0A9W7VXP3_9PEZI|nr:hypothetical protein Tdes44962_MAKER10440 [Teratosphaeria destructans]